MALRAPDTGTMECKLGPLSGDNAARRRLWRIVGVGMGLLRHDGKVESVVVEDDAVLILGVRGRARYAQAHILTRCRHNRVPRVSQGSMLRHEDLYILGSAVDSFEEGHQQRFP